MSEREGSQRERGARSAGRPPRRVSEREGSQRERGARRAGRPALASADRSEERPQRAWRVLDSSRKLRRPAGTPEDSGELPDDLASGLALDGADLSGTRREKLTLVDSVLRRCELTAASWQQVTVRQTEVLDCRALGLRMSVDHAQDLYVADCRLDQAVLHIARVRGLVVFERCSFAEAELAGDLSRVVAVDCDFDRCEFAATAADGFDLRGSRLAGSRGLLTLRGARVTADQTLTVADRLATEAGLTVEN